jgi:ABC-type cobalt transport system substrate-binding protein
MLGTIIFMGLSIGSILGMKVFSNFDNIKYILVTILATLAVILVAFTISGNYRATLGLRMIQGLMKVFVPIFTPVWVDSFGTEKTKSIMMSVSLMGGVMGFFVGFQLTFAAKWKFCIYS